MLMLVFSASFAYASELTGTDSSSTVTDSTSSMYSIQVGDTVQINYLIPVATTISWNTLDSKIADVLNDGRIFGKSIGITSIYITKADGSVMMKWEVQVTPKIIDPILIDTGISINPEPPIYNSDYTIMIGESVTIESPVMIALPYSWISINPAIAKVDQNGTVTGISKGLDTISVALANGSIVSTYTVYVADTSINILPPPIYNPNDYILSLGETINISPNVTYTTTIKWKSLDPKIATIDTDGNVTGLTIGSTVIYMCLPNDSVISKYLITVLDTVSVIYPTINAQYVKLAIGETYTLKSDSLNTIYVSTDSTIKASGIYNFIAKQIGQTQINEYNRWGNLLTEWYIYVYDPSYIIPIDSSVVNGYSYKNIYVNIGDTVTIYNYLNVQPSPNNAISWATTGVIDLLYDGSTFVATTSGYTKCNIKITNASGTIQDIYLVVNVASNSSIGLDSLRKIIALPIITPTNFIYQNYTAVEQIDSTVLRIIFDKEITDISEIAKYLELNIQYQAIVSNQLKTGNTLTITSVSIDPTNNKAIIITTKEAIPATANVSLTFNNVALLSTNGESFNQLSQTATFVKTTKPVSISVYPNIASSTITISAESIATIEIYSINGILFDRFTASSAIQTIDVSAYRSGTYIVKLKTSKAQTISRPFIKL
jgi:hypothetical protein